MTEKFDGFPPGFFKFFKELADNNNREWFNDNKPRYLEQVVEPSIAFIEAIAPKLEKISPYFVADPRPNGGSMFRIYRDVRFSKDKRPYKENVGFRFGHYSKKSNPTPGFYIGLSPKQTHHGGGIWHPPAPALKKIRDHIAQDPEAWKKVVSNRTLKSRTGGISGEGLKRPPKGYDPDDPFIEDLKRKSFFAMTEGKVSDAKSKDFVNDVAKSFRAAAPLVHFISDAVGAEF